MKSMKYLVLFAITCATIMCTGCASGPKYASVVDSLPALEEAGEQGRIFIYRDGSIFGVAVQASVLLNEVAVGKSRAGSFFFVDVDQGNCEVSCETESESSITFDIAAGETKYVRTRVELGVLVGRIVPYLETEEVAMKTLPSTSYIGEQDLLDKVE